MAKQLKFWNIVKNDDNKSAELIMYGVIGNDEYWDDISDKAFKQDIENLGDVENITLHINSPGGSAISAIAIANTLKNHKATVTANIDGIAASAATLITSACDVVRMPKNAMFMIHNPMTAVYGNNQDMEKALELLNKIKDSIMETYLNKVSIGKETLSDLMNEETWLNATEAKAYGFVDEIIDEEIESTVINNRLIVNNMAFDITKFKNFNKDTTDNRIDIENTGVSENNENKEENMTLEKLKNEYPDLYNQIMNEGRESGINEERARLKAIDEMDVENYPDLVEKAKYTEPTQASNLAMNILQKQKEEKAQKMQNIKDESAVNSTPAVANNGTIDNSNGKSFMGIDIANIIKGMNKKTEGR